MNKRQAFYALLLVALIAVGVIVWWLVGPLLNKAPATPAAQPPALPTSVTPVIPAVPTSSAPQQVVLPNQEQQREDQAEDAAIQRARLFASLAGTYSSTEGFSSLHDLRAQATPEMQNFLQAEQARLAALHPAFGSSWTQSTKALSARIVSGLPILGKESVQLVVQTQQTVETNDAKPVVSYQEATVGLTKVGNAWNVSSVTWKPFQP